MFGFWSDRPRHGCPCLRRLLISCMPCFNLDMVVSRQDIIIDSPVKDKVAVIIANVVPVSLMKCGDKCGAIYQSILLSTQQTWSSLMKRCRKMRVVSHFWVARLPDAKRVIKVNEKAGSGRRGIRHRPKWHLQCPLDISVTFGRYRRYRYIERTLYHSRRFLGTCFQVRRRFIVFLKMRLV